MDGLSFLDVVYAVAGGNLITAVVIYSAWRMSRNEDLERPIYFVCFLIFIGIIGFAAFEA